MISKTGGRQEQGQIQGVSGALESLGRTVGPVWGNGFLSAFGEGIAYLSAAAVLGLLALWGARLSLYQKKAQEMTNVPSAPTVFNESSSSR
jgi:hypothetical protein